MVFVLQSTDTEKTIELQKRINIFYLQQIPLTSKDNHFHNWENWKKKIIIQIQLEINQACL